MPTAICNDTTWPQYEDVFCLDCNGFLAKDGRCPACTADKPDPRENR